MKKTTQILLGLCVAVLPLPSVGAEPPKAPEQRVRELQDLRWGIFVCWSFSTFSGKEWTPGVKDVSFFRATTVDTDQWARTAKEAEMGYILFLTKHHDGFCLWDTATTDRKVTKAPLGRDVLAELRKSCDKYGIKLALYFSEGEWTWPDKPGGGRYQANGGYNPGLKKAQLKELLTQYGPIEYIWMDHAIGDGGLGHPETVAFCKSLQPDCFIGFNHGPAAGDIRLGEKGHPAPLSDPSGAGFNHGHMKAYTGYRLAEFTYPILPPHQGGAMWFYSLPKHDNLCRSAEALYEDYRGALKYGNIFSIDAGPNYDGKLRKIDVETLRKVGEMIRNPPPPPPPPIPAVRTTASGTWTTNPGYTPDKATDGDFRTRWGCKEGSRSGWLELDLGRDHTVAKTLLDEAGFGRIRRYQLEVREGDNWRTVAAGTTCGDRNVVKFDKPAKGRFFRLHILEASEVPTVGEFQLFE